MPDPMTEAPIQLSETGSPAGGEIKDPFAELLKMGPQADTTESPVHSGITSTEPPQFSSEDVASSMQQMQLLRDEIEKQQAAKGALPQANGAAAGTIDQQTLREAFIPSQGEKKSGSSRNKNLLSELKLEKAGTFIKTVLEMPGRAIKFIGKNLMKLWTSGDSPRTPVNSPPAFPQAA